MKHNIILLYAFAAFVALCLGACSIETDTVDGDGDFEGFWHLVQIETVAADSTEESTIQDLSKQRLFWSFQHKLLQLRDFDENNSTYLCRFEIANGQFTITEAYYAVYGNDTLMTDISDLAPYGVMQINVPYSYQIDGSNMTLSYGNTRLRLKKF